MVSGAPAEPHGINLEGLKRRGFSKESIHAIKEAHKILYRQNLGVDEALTKIQTELGADPSIQTLIAFAKHTQRGLIR